MSRILSAFVCVAVVAVASAFNVGVGVYDTTGPATEINFMGYAVPGQRGTGIHLRLRARAFVIEESGDSQDKVAFVSVDGGMASDLVKMRVLDQLKEKVGEGVFTNDNVMISGTHTHSGPAGFLQYVLYQTTSLGFVAETFDAWVGGITNAIIMANENIIENTSISYNEGDLWNSNINRSPTSYLENPQSERDEYPQGDTDKTMTLLRFSKKDAEGNDEVFGIINWFAVHATSMNNTNTLISGDNKGYASYELEKKMNSKNGANIAQPGHGPFVAAFASSNLGDVSPNTNGPKCIDTGEPCDGTTSTCNGRCEKCIAFGPGFNGDMTQSTQIIGHKQASFAEDLMNNANTEIKEGSNGVSYRHSFVKFDTLNVTLPGVEDKVELCSPSMGYAFAAGTTDGPGMFGFKQHTTTGNAFWDKVSDFLSEPTEREIACQAPKPILLNTGDITIPYEWDPTTIGLQMFKIGNIFIVSVPSEFTTMSGRRARKSLKKIVQDMLPEGEEAKIVIAGLSNGYSSYVTTLEEYQAQRYEAASTIFGPNTLAGYIQELSRIATDMVKGTETTTDLPPKDMQNEMVEMMPSVKFDRHPLGSKFGSIVKGEDVNTETAYRPTIISSSGTLDGSMPSDDESDLSHVHATFHAANPRNNQKIQGTFLTVEKQDDTSGGGGWTVVRTDGDWDTSFHWIAGIDDKYAFGLSPLSRTIVTWNLNRAQQENALNGNKSLAGTYRICYYGDHKELGSNHRIIPFDGCSSAFQVEDASA